MNAYVQLGSTTMPLGDLVSTFDFLVHILLTRNAALGFRATGTTRKNGTVIFIPIHPDQNSAAASGFDAFDGGRH